VINVRRHPLADIIGRLAFAEAAGSITVWPEHSAEVILEIKTVVADGASVESAWPAIEWGDRSRSSSVPPGTARMCQPNKRFSYTDGEE
jgi:hypothetical protein